MDDITDKISKYILGEASNGDDIPLFKRTEFNIMNAATLRKIRDFFLVIGDTRKLKKEKISREEKLKRVNKNVGALNYILRGKEMPIYVREMLSSGIENTIEHVGFRLSDLDVKIRK